MPDKKPLSATFAKIVKQPGRYGDGRGSFGLSLLVKQGSTGRVSKSWTQRVLISGKYTSLGLGSYPRTTLAEARGKALANRRELDQGIDPRKPEAVIPTFASALDSVIAIHAPNWRNPKTARQWRSSLETHAALLMPRLVSEITSGDVLACMAAMTGKKDIAVKVKQRIGLAMRWCIAEGYRTDNPAGDAVTAVLPKTNKRSEHHRALPFADVGKAIDTIRETDAWPATRLGFEFLVLTACRSGEVRLAQWAEVDLAGQVLTIPGDRMKTGRSHRIPLSDRAMDVLRQARELADDSGLIFPSPRGKALTDSTISKLCRENNLGCVPHGMRTSFRMWAAECTDVPREVCEFALAHVVGSAAEQAYQRSDLFERRRELMTLWADFVSS